MPNKQLFGIILLFFLLVQNLHAIIFTYPSYINSSSLSTIIDKSKNNSYFKTNIKQNNLTDVECLAFAIYGESRGEGHKGMLAVAFVIHNRYKMWNMPSYCSVVKSNGQFQFQIYKPKNVEEMLLWKSVLNTSYHLIEKDGFANMESPVANALYFRTSKGKQFSNKRYIKTIKNHHFYN